MFPFCARLHHFKNNKEQSHVFRGGVDLEEAAEKLFRRLPLRTHPPRSYLCIFFCVFFVFELCEFMYFLICDYVVFEFVCLLAHIHPGRASVDLCTSRFMHLQIYVFSSLCVFVFVFVFLSLPVVFELE